jgi:hypothetical protein
MTGHFYSGHNGQILAYFPICSRQVRPNNLEAHA